MSRFSAVSLEHAVTDRVRKLTQQQEKMMMEQKLKQLECT
jgi:hypothetical protein